MAAEQDGSFKGQYFMSKVILGRRGGIWVGARAIWSQWDGYLRSGPGAALKAEFAACSVLLEVVHTSGAASIGDLRRPAAAIAAAALVPVHTSEGGRFAELFGANVVRRADGEWWGV